MCGEPSEAERIHGVKFTETRKRTRHRPPPGPARSAPTAHASRATGDAHTQTSRRAPQCPFTFQPHCHSTPLSALVSTLTEPRYRLTRSNPSTDSRGLTRHTRATHHGDQRARRTFARLGESALRFPAQQSPGQVVCPGCRVRLSWRGGPGSCGRPRQRRR